MTAEEDITAESAVSPIAETQAGDKRCAVGVDLMPGPLLGLRILVEEGQLQPMPHSTPRRLAADHRMAADKTTAVATTSNPELQQHVAEHTSSAASRFGEPSLLLKILQVIITSSLGREGIFMHIDLSKQRDWFGFLAAFLFIFLGTITAPGQ